MLWIFFVLFSSSAWAYIVPVEFSFSQWTSRISSIDSLSIHASRVPQASGMFQNESKADIDIWIKRPNLYKRVVTEDGRSQEYILGSNRAVVVEQGQSRTASIGEVVDVASLFFLSNKESRMKSMAMQMGFDPSLKKMMHHELGKELLYGSNQNHGGYSFLVTEGNHQYFPQRVIDGKTTYVFVYREGQIFPSEIKIYERKQLKESIVVESVTINPKLSNTLFEVRN
ncbi:MAG: hypothetical protein KDD52_03585 [Bdellovibrionales bacterium]|nr:hypothetical protein [Bdellovibrionales bacterium]